MDMSREENIKRIIELLEKLGVIPPPTLPNIPGAGQGSRPEAP